MKRFFLILVSVGMITFMSAQNTQQLHSSSGMIKKKKVNYRKAYYRLVDENSNLKLVENRQKTKINKLERIQKILKTNLKNCRVESQNIRSQNNLLKRRIKVLENELIKYNPKKKYIKKKKKIIKVN